MPNVIYIDTVDQAYLETGDVGRKVRGALVKYGDLPPSIPDSYVLEKCVLALNAAHPDTTLLAQLGTTPLFVKRHVARPKGADVISIQIHYEQLSGSLTGSWLLRDSTTLTNVQTNMLPGTREPINVDWKDIWNARNYVPRDYVTMNYRAPFRTRLISGIAQGIPPAAERKAIRHVNSVPYMGLPKGYWLIDDYKTETRNRGSTYTVEASVSTKDEEDWSEYGILRNHMTGRYVHVRKEDMDDLVTAPYKPGISKTNGAVRVGFYQLVNMATFFGLLPE